MDDRLSACARPMLHKDVETGRLALPASACIVCRRYSPPCSPLINVLLRHRVGGDVGRWGEGKGGANVLIRWCVGVGGRSMTEAACQSRDVNTSISVRRKRRQGRQGRQGRGGTIRRCKIRGNIFKQFNAGTHDKPPGETLE